MKKLILGITVILSANIPLGAMADVVGAIMPAKNIPYYMAIHDAMTKELQALDSNAEVLLQKPSPSIRSWSNATRKLVILGAEVIVAYGSATAVCIGGENANIPVVYSGAYKPVNCGIAGTVRNPAS